jgi:hypothetical protein
MAWFDEVLGGWGWTALVGLGVVVAAPLVLPLVGAVVRPVAKVAVKGGLFVVDSLQELVAEGSEQLSDMVAEARAEYTASRSGPAA